MSFGKGTIGSSVPWIGATVSITSRTGESGLRFPGVLIALQESKFKELQANVDTIYRSKGTTQLKLVRTVAGQISWASGIFEWLKSFGAFVWAALTSHSSSLTSKKSLRKKRPTDLFFVVALFLVHLIDLLSCVLHCLCGRVPNRRSAQ